MVELISHDLLTTEEIEQLISFAKNNGGIEYAYSTMERLSDRARGILDAIAEATEVDQDSYDALNSIIDYIVNRDK